MLKEILKKGIPFAVLVGLFQVFLDYVDDMGTVKMLIKKHALISLVFGLGFGIIVTYFNRRNEAKAKD